jgi:hypothetical protein
MQVGSFGLRPQDDSTKPQDDSSEGISTALSS